RRRRHLTRLELTTRRDPGRESAVEHAHVLVPEPAQAPPRARGRSRDPAVVRDDAAPGTHAEALHRRGQCLPRRQRVAAAGAGRTREVGFGVAEGGARQMPGPVAGAVGAGERPPDVEQQRVATLGQQLLGAHGCAHGANSSTRPPVRAARCAPARHDGRQVSAAAAPTLGREVMAETVHAAREEIRTLLVLGASGDLAGRLLLPGLGRLLATGRAPELRLVGSGVDDWDDAQWRKRLTEAFAVQPSIEMAPWEAFPSLAHEPGEETLR